jgi:hypothetical protein
VPFAPTESPSADLDVTTPLPTPAAATRVRSAPLATGAPAQTPAALTAKTVTVRVPRLLAVFLPLPSNLDLPFSEAVSL